MQIDGFDWQVCPIDRPHLEDYNGRRYLRRYRGGVWSLANRRPQPPAVVLDLARRLRVRRWGRKPARV